MSSHFPKNNNSVLMVKAPLLIYSWRIKLSSDLQWIMMTLSAGNIKQVSILHLKRKERKEGQRQTIWYLPITARIKLVSLQWPTKCHLPSAWHGLQWLDLPYDSCLSSNVISSKRILWQSSHCSHTNPSLSHYSLQTPVPRITLSVIC